MNEHKLHLATALLFFIVTAACNADIKGSSEPVFSNEDKITETITPRATGTTAATEVMVSSTPTLLPGEQTIPIDEFANLIPWRAPDPRGPTFITFLGFNVSKPPFDNPLVRRSFAASADRETIARLERANESNLQDITPASTLSPPSVIGRNLFGSLGPVYDPTMAQQLLSDAGYPAAQGFPEITFIVLAFGNPVGHPEVLRVQSLVDNWIEILEVQINVEIVASGYDEYYSRINGGDTDIFMLDWLADYEDPHNFLKDFWVSYDFPGYDNLIFGDEELNQLLLDAEEAPEPAVRLTKYLQIETIITEEKALVIPLFHAIWTTP